MKLNAMSLLSTSIEFHAIEIAKVNVQAILSIAIMGFNKHGKKYNVIFYLLIIPHNISKYLTGIKLLIPSKAKTFPRGHRCIIVVLVAVVELECIEMRMP